MVSDRVVGVLLMIASILIIVVYFWLLFLPPRDIEVMGMDISTFVVRATIMIGVFIIFGLIAWIGYTLATTPPPKPIEEVEREIERELEKIEAESGGEKKS